MPVAGKIFPTSAWNRALVEGKIVLIPLGPFTHNGKGNYFDNETTLPSGETHMEFVLEKIRRRWPRRDYHLGIRRRLFDPRRRALGAPSAETLRAQALEGIRPSSRPATTAYAVLHLQLAENVGRVVAHSVGRDDQPVGNLLVRSRSASRRRTSVSRSVSGTGRS